LNSVTAISANNAWAVGFTAGHNLIEHWNGAAWSIVSAPAPRNSDLFSVSGTGPNDVWAVGSAGRSDSRVQILHFDGTSWTAVSAPNPSPFANTLTSISADSPTDAWAVGFTTSGALIEHWDGTSWSVVPSPNSSSITLSGISAASPTNVWAVGSTTNPTTGFAQTVTEHFDGTQWTIVPSPTSSTQNQSLRAVSALSDGTVTAVGSASTSGPTGTGGPLILQN
jgi:hypothetical protein